VFHLKRPSDGTALEPKEIYTFDSLEGHFVIIQREPVEKTLVIAGPFL
jgi:hypothetical protein